MEKVKRILRKARYKLYATKFYIKHFNRRKVEKIAAKVRKKPVIRVVFELHEIAKWKTESLYLAMLEHPRFEPIIVTTPSASYQYSATAYMYVRLIEVLERKGYPYIESSRQLTMSELVDPDIVFMQEPYKRTVPKNNYFTRNGDVLFCFVNYGFQNLIIPALVNHRFLNVVWQRYFTSQIDSDDIAAVMTTKGVNHVVTGIPIQDYYLQPIDRFPEQWKLQDSKKKRIIWAPHHTIPTARNDFEQSTFLEIADDMLKLAEKYKDKVQWAFKPHPMLFNKLLPVWGAARINEYYAKWRDLEYSQLETGEYGGLFMHSDALIHDCSSFIIEYQYSHKPAFFIQNGHDNTKDFTTCSKKAYNFHYKGSAVEDIERFINEVVLEGNDPMKQARDEFFNEYLLPPNGKTACENIIDSILGE